MTVTASDWIALAGIVIGSGALVVGWRMLRGVGEVIEDWRGRPERRDPMTGVVIDPGRPSMPGRMAAMEAQLHPNHGTSMNDQVAWLVEAVKQMQRERAGAPEEVRQ